MTITSHTPMKTIRFFLIPICMLMLLAFSACEKTNMPVIKQVKISETAPGTILATATILADEIDEVGVCYSTKQPSPTASDNDGIIHGTWDNDSFEATLNLRTNTNYYFVVYASNRAGTTYSATTRIKTSLRAPDENDNPMPKI